MINILIIKIIQLSLSYYFAHGCLYMCLFAVLNTLDQDDASGRWPPRLGAIASISLKPLLEAR